MAPVGPEQSLTYSLTVQKIRNKKPDGDPFNSSGQEIFGNGWKFRLNIQPSQEGALYLLSVGPGKNGSPEYNILFPSPKQSRLDPKLVANQTTQSSWFQFVEQAGVERLWIIWASQAVAELDAIFGRAADNKREPGVIADPDQIAQIEVYLKRYQSERPEVIADKSKEVTFVRGRGDVLVNLVELSHKAY